MGAGEHFSFAERSWKEGLEVSYIQHNPTVRVIVTETILGRHERLGKSVAVGGGSMADVAAAARLASRDHLDVCVDLRITIDKRVVRSAASLGFCSIRMA